MEVKSVLKLKQRSGWRKANKSKSFVNGNTKKTKSDSTQSNSKNNWFKISRPAPIESLVETTEQFWKRSMVEDNFITPYSKVDFSTNRKATEHSIDNLKLKESPNYQSIMDLWSNSVAKYGKLYMKLDLFT